MDSLLALLDQTHFTFDIIAITETRINTESIPHNLNIPNYSFISTKTEAAAGGTLVYIHESINYKIRDDLSSLCYVSKFLESSFLEIIRPNNKNIIVGCIYKHPVLNNTDFIENKFSPLLNKMNKEQKTIALLGDFNIDIKKDNVSSDFTDTLCSNAFFPSITLPTRLTDHSETLIDNIFVNSNRYPIKSGNLLVGISDHLPQFALLDTGTCEKTRVDKYYEDWKSFNQNHFVDQFKQIDWETTLQLYKQNPDVSFLNFFNTLDSLIKKHVPLKRVTKRQSLRKPWITKGIQKSILRRDRLLKQLRSEKNKHTKTVKFNQYKILRNQIVTLIRISKKNHYRNYFTQNVHNSNKVWMGINELITLKNIKGLNKIILKTENKNITEALDIATEFNKFFTNITTKIREKVPPTKKNFNDFLNQPTRQSFFFSPANSEEIKKIILGLDPKKATGPLSIPNKILRLLITEISDILTKIFNQSLETGKFITPLKTAKVIPLFKNKGSEQEVSNYRPIALLSNLDKIFEKLVHHRLISYLEKFNLLFNRQFGFRKKHATTHNLISLSEKIREDLDKGEFSCGIFLDLQKAFDSVDHDILLKKLENYGIRGVANHWISSYLSERKQYVEVEGKKSSLANIRYGVPQGSVLGPLLFLIYVNDFQNSILYSKAYIFADDTAVNYSNKSLKALKKRLNIDLKLMSHWLSANKIALNVTKTEMVLFRDPRKRLDYTVKIKLQGKQLRFNDQTKYLGVYLDKHLNWKYHVEKLAVNLRKTNGIISKIRHFVPQETLIQVYYALFQSKLDYGLQVWGQGFPINNRIFKLQKTCLRLMTFTPPDTPSQPLFNQMKIQTMKDLIFLTNIKLVFKTLKKETPNSISNALDLKYVAGTMITRGNSACLLKRHKIRTSTYGLNSIKYMSVLNWNTLQNFSNINLKDLSNSQIKSITLEYLSLQK